MIEAFTGDAGTITRPSGFTEIRALESLKGIGKAEFGSNRKISYSGRKHMKSAVKQQSYCFQRIL